VAGEQEHQRTDIQTMLASIKALLPGLEEDDVMNLELLVQRSNDPVVLATLIAALLEERRRTNALLREIRDALNELRSSSPSAPAPQEGLGLSEPDERIIALIHERGAVTAADVREALGYKGLNAASARLNALYKQGILRKVRKGRKVYYTLAP